MNAFCYGSANLSKSVKIFQSYWQKFAATFFMRRSVLQFRPSLERIVDRVERSVLVHLSYGPQCIAV